MWSNIIGDRSYITKAIRGTQPNNRCSCVHNENAAVWRHSKSTDTCFAIGLNNLLRRKNICCLLRKLRSRICCRHSTHLLPVYEINILLIGWYSIHIKSALSSGLIIFYSDFSGKSILKGSEKYKKCSLTEVREHLYQNRDCNFDRALMCRFFTVTSAYPNMSPMYLKSLSLR